MSEHTICPDCGGYITVEAKFGDQNRVFIKCPLCGRRLIVRPWVLYSERHELSL